MGEVDPGGIPYFVRIMIRGRATAPGPVRLAGDSALRARALVVGPHTKPSAAFGIVTRISPSNSCIELISGGFSQHGQLIRIGDLQPGSSRSRKQTSLPRIRSTMAGTTQSRRYVRSIESHSNARFPYRCLWLKSERCNHRSMQ
jgi:hypothetical protein